METLLKVLGGILLVMIVLAIGAVLSGTILFWIWPIAIPAAFPTLVASGVLSAKLSWSTSVCLVWIFSLLIKATQTNNNK